MTEPNPILVRREAEFNFTRMCVHMGTIRKAIEHSKGKYNLALAALVAENCTVPTIRANIEVRYDFFLAELSVIHSVHCTLLTGEKDLLLDEVSCNNTEWVRGKMIDLAQRYERFHYEIFEMIKATATGLTVIPAEPTEEQPRRWWQLWKKS